MRKLFSVTEKVYGNMATVFHRTRASDLINQVYTSGFKPGTGDRYGKGFYSTYDYESQLGQRMEQYGDVIVKFAVPLRDFLIFDKEVFVKSPTHKAMKLQTPDMLKLSIDISMEIFEDWGFLLGQLRYFNIPIVHRLIDLLKMLSKLKTKGVYTSDIAQFVYDDNRGDLLRKCRGIVFTGRRDGRVLVAYDPSIIIPLSYKLNNEPDFQAVDRNMDYLRKWSKRKNAPYGSQDSGSSFWNALIDKIERRRGEAAKSLLKVWNDYRTEISQLIEFFAYESDLDWNMFDKQKVEIAIIDYIRDNDLINDDAYMYGRNNPEYFISEEPSDQDEEGNPMWSEEQRNEAEMGAMGEAEDSFVNEIWGKSYRTFDRNFKDVFREIIDIDYIDETYFIRNVLFSFIERMDDYEEFLTEVSGYIDEDEVDKVLRSI